MGLRGRTRLEDKVCFFVTTTCSEFKPFLVTEKSKEIICDNFRFYSKKYNCRIVAYVIMPEHLHFICYFMEGTKLIDFMRDFKKFTSFQLRKHFLENGLDIQEILYEYRQQKFKIWMDRFDDVFLYSRKVILTKVNYIHQNPVKRGLCEKACEYKYSSAGFYETGAPGEIDILHVEEIL